MQLRQTGNKYSNDNEPLSYPTDILIQPSKQAVIYIKSKTYIEKEEMGPIQTSNDLEDNDDLIICPTLSTTRNRQFAVHVINFLEQPFSLKKGYHIATFSILSPEQAKDI